jgi:hypothetical protein
MLNPETPRDAFKQVSWEEQATAVLIPSWIGFVTEHTSLLQSMTVGTLFESRGGIPHITSQIPDPKDMLLTPEQRVARARSLVAMALGLCLTRHGWELHSGPGTLQLERANNQLHPFKVVLRLSDGEVSKEGWMARCQELGIENIPLVSAT